MIWRLFRAGVKTKSGAVEPARNGEGRRMSGAELIGRRGVPYDAAGALEALREGRLDEAWAELWDELHHQGDVGAASYAAVPRLVDIARESGMRDWNLFALVAIIEECRLGGKNPPLPSSMEDSYKSALSELANMAAAGYPETTDGLLSGSMLAVLAFAKGHCFVGSFALLTEDEQQELMESI